MNNFRYITPEELKREHPDNDEPLEKLQAIAKAKTKKCENCDEKEWKYGESGLCFSCTTGESDASEDYELI